MLKYWWLWCYKMFFVLIPDIPEVIYTGSLYDLDRPHRDVCVSLISRLHGYVNYRTFDCHGFTHTRHNSQSYWYNSQSNWYNSQIYRHSSQCVCMCVLCAWEESSYLPLAFIKVPLSLFFFSLNLQPPPASAIIHQRHFSTKCDLHIITASKLPPVSGQKVDHGDIITFSPR